MKRTIKIQLAVTYETAGTLPQREADLTAYALAVRPNLHTIENGVQLERVECHTLEITHTTINENQ